MDRVDSQILWGLIFRRNLNESDEKDCRYWVSSQDRLFSFASFFQTLSSSAPPLQTVSGKIYGSPRLLLTLLLLDWLVLWGKILTMDNHRRWNMILLNTCPLCLSAEESIDHLLLRCKMGNMIWNSYISNFGCCLVLPYTISDLFTLPLGICRQDLPRARSCGN